MSPMMNAISFANNCHDTSIRIMQQGQRVGMVFRPAKRLGSVKPVGVPLRPTAPDKDFLATHIYLSGMALLGDSLQIRPCLPERCAETMLLIVPRVAMADKIAAEVCQGRLHL